MINNFTLKELGAPSEDCFHPGFLSRLELLRLYYDMRMIVNSCARTKKYNDSLLNSSPRSLHIWDKCQHKKQLGCLAIDIKMKNSYKRRKLVKTALNLGWSIGIAPTFLHLDLRYLINLKKLLFVY